MVFLKRADLLVSNEHKGKTVRREDKFAVLFITIGINL